MGMFGEMNKLDGFQDQARGAFAFLHDYGFILERSGAGEGEAYLRFVREDIVVDVNYQLGDEPWVALSFPRRGERKSLKKMAQQLQVTNGVAGSNETLRQQIDRNAALLRACMEAYRDGDGACL
jgi:hypothetical protein